ARQSVTSPGNGAEGLWPNRHAPSPWKTRTPESSVAVNRRCAPSGTSVLACNQKRQPDRGWRMKTPELCQASESEGAHLAIQHLFSHGGRGCNADTVKQVVFAVLAVGQVQRTYIHRTTGFHQTTQHLARGDVFRCQGLGLIGFQGQVAGFVAKQYIHLGTLLGH